MARSESTGQGDTETGAGGPVLRAQLAVEPHPVSGCGVVNAADARDVSQHLKTDPEFRGDARGQGCGECHTELTFEGETDREYRTSTVTTRCICPVFERHDCIPQIRGVRSGTIVLGLTLPRREILREVITDLRSTGADVSVEWLVAGGETDTTAEIDVSTITDKQQEAMETAMELGYYATPREADLGALATELGISESAASQRLNAAETKLVTAFLDE